MCALDKICREFRIKTVLFNQLWTFLWRKNTLEDYIMRCLLTLEILFSKDFSGKKKKKKLKKKNKFIIRMIDYLDLDIGHMTQNYIRYLVTITVKQNNLG